MGIFPIFTSIYLQNDRAFYRRSFYLFRIGEIDSKMPENGILPELRDVRLPGQSGNDLQHDASLSNRRFCQEQD